MDMRLFALVLPSIVGLCSSKAVLPPGPVNGALGGSVTFNTTISSEGPIQTIFWNFDDGSGSGSVPVITVSSGTTIDGPGYEGRVSVNSFTGSLELRELTLGDTGLYLVSMITSKPESGSTTLNVYGSSITLSCSAQSSPPAQFQWALNGKMLDREGQELKLENVQRNQSGSYICWAHNSITLRYTASKPSVITVLEKISGAEITGPSEPLIAGKSSANLSCQAAAGTSISREWLKGDQPLSPSHRITFSEDKSSVSISPVESTDNGEYQCRLSNPVSTDTVSYNLTVNYGPEDVLIKGATEVEEGKMVELICFAKSEPPANFSWTTNGTDTSVTTAKYIIYNATYDDSGNYTCVAENAVTGLSRSSAVHVLTVGGEGSQSDNGPNVRAIVGASNQQANSPDQITYADVSVFNKKDGGTVELGTPETVYTDVRTNLGRAQATTVPEETQYAMNVKMLIYVP
ncbi:hypothetical protein JZ751_028603 [Albula glossodonta]|uniref:Ig-like domain-containing protein n=1 Tax=Albula glossodonta TaxID=121402 RepID=A0A8T2MNB5_9TELE|nr:hypothetical protein JZ751_028603 [Albula glossodonta]